MQFTDYSDYHAAQPRFVTYRELVPGSLTLPSAPRFIFGSVPGELSRMMFARCRVHKIGLWSLRGAVVTRDHIVMHDRHVLTSSSTNHPEEHCRAVMGGVSFDPHANPRPIGGRVVSLGGPGWHTWGHWLTDFLPRLYLFRMEGWDLKGLRWLLPAAVPQYAYDLLEMFGIGRGSILLFDEQHEAVAPAELIVAENFGAGSVMHPLYAEACHWIRSCLAGWREQVPGPAKVFLSRVSTPTWRRLKAREQLEAAASQFGYEVADPASLSARQQYTLLSNATHIAGEYGSALHSSIFSSQGTVVTCFRGATASAGFLQNGICSALRQPLGYVIGRMAPDDDNQSFELDSSDIRLGFETADQVALS